MGEKQNSKSYWSKNTMGPFVIVFFKIDFGSVMCFCYNFFINFFLRKASNEK